jgi:tetratricopeptide (TPR) repeat protein
MTALLNTVVFFVLSMPVVQGAQMSIPDRFELFRLIRDAAKLAPGEAAEIEKRLEANPENLRDRLQLIGYYRLNDPAHREPRRKHMLWVIQNHPDLPSTIMTYTQLNSRDPGYAEGRRIWLEHVTARPNDPVVIRNAARYFVLADRELAERLYKQGEALTPKDYFWATDLGSLYMLQARNSDDTEYARKAVEAYERALQLAPRREFVLNELGEAAFEAEMFDKAEQYATEASLSSRPDAVHYGFWILGEMALMRGDIEAAKSHLISSAKIPGSPVLGSFGPRMQLASKLLARDERGTVVAYLQECLKFWKSGQERLQQWIVLINNGENPNLGWR